jgi:hypothetical protein
MCDKAAVFSAAIQEKHHIVQTVCSSYFPAYCMDLYFVFAKVVAYFYCFVFGIKRVYLASVGCLSCKCRSVTLCLSLTGS